MNRPTLKLLAPFIAFPLSVALFGQTPPPVPIGTVAGHSLLRVLVNGGVAEAIGYFPFVDSLGNRVFNGTPGERSAMLAFRTPQFRVNTLANGKVLMLRPTTLLVEGLVYNVYFDPAPSRDFAQPATFSSGQLVGVYKGNTAAIVSIEGQTVTYGASLELSSSSDFVLNGETVNLASIAKAIHVSVLGPAPTFEQIGSGTLISIPLGGSFTATATRQSK
jgi:hypothetical protein